MTCGFAVRRAGTTPPVPPTNPLSPARPDAARRRARRGPLLLGTALLPLGALLSGCSGGSFSLADAVEGLPTSDHDEFAVVVGDVERAAEIAGLERPDGDDEDAVVAWAAGLSGYGDDPWGGSVLLPSTLAPERAVQHEAVADELGLSLVDVEGFAEVQAPPYRFAVLDGEVDRDRLEEQQGEPDGDTWRIGDGDDLSSDVDALTPARPLGQPLTVVAEDDRVVAALSAGDVDAFEDGETDEGVAALAAALDDQDVYSAWIGRYEYGGSGDGLPAAFDTAAIGFAPDGDDQVVVAAYHHDDSAAAEENAEAVGDVLDGSRAPLELLDTEVDGDVLVVTFRLDDDAAPGVVWSIPTARDPLFSHD